MALRLNTEVQHDTLTGHVQGDQPLSIGRGDTLTFFRGLLDDVQLFSRQLSAAEVAVLAGGDPILAILSTPPRERTAEERLALRRHYLELHDPEYRAAFAAAALAKSRQKQILAAAPSTMVMQELTVPRKTFVLARGLYDQRGEQVTAGTPAFLPPMGSELAAESFGSRAMACRYTEPARRPAWLSIGPGRRYSVQDSSARRTIGALVARSRRIPSCSTGWRRTSSLKAGT